MPNMGIIMPDMGMDVKGPSLLAEHAWKLPWRFAIACHGFRLPLRSQPLSGGRVASVDKTRPIDRVTLRLRHSWRLALKWEA